MPRYLGRPLPLAALVAVLSSGTGLPMCLSLGQRAGKPCPMHEAQHEHGSGTHTSHIVSVAAATPDHTCHPGDVGLGCASVGACPSTSVAAPAWTAVPVGPGGAAVDLLWAPAGVLVSFLAPPLSPPPQA